MKAYFFLLSSLLLFLSESIHSQDDLSCIDGLVTDAKNEPVIDAHVYIDSVKTNIKTNRKGQFSICLPKEEKMITVYSKSNGILEVLSGNSSLLQFVYAEEAKIISEIELADLGYNSEHRKKYKSRKKKVKDYGQFQNVYQALAAEIPGAQISGDLIYLRGTARKSLVSEPAPLLFIDGTLVSSFSTVTPNEIASIEVIRDERAALYGSRGSGGIIKIELKK